MADCGIGIVGYGGFGQFLHGAWTGLDGMKVVAVSDVDASRDPKTVEFHADWHDLLKRPDVEVVAVGTPPATHCEIGLACMEAGKHVLLEKPPAISVADAERLLEASKRTGRLAAVDYMLRYNPLVEALRKVAESGVMGRLQHVSVVNYAGDSQLGPGHWFWNPAVSGGIFVEHAVHFFDMVAYIHASPPQRVTAHAVSREAGMQDKVTAIVAHKDGLVATHHHHFFRPNWFERQTFRLGFDLGEVDMEGWIPLSLKIRAIVNERGRDTLSGLFEDAAFSKRTGDWPGARAGGKQYSVSSEVTLAYSLPAQKQDAYRDCVRTSIKDVAQAARGGKEPRIALAKVMDSVRVACACADSATDGQARDLQVPG